MSIDLDTTFYDPLENDGEVLAAAVEKGFDPTATYAIVALNDNNEEVLQSLNIQLLPIQYLDALILPNGRSAVRKINPAIASNRSVYDPTYYHVAKSEYVIHDNEVVLTQIISLKDNVKEIAYKTIEDLTRQSREHFATLTDGQEAVYAQKAQEAAQALEEHRLTGMISPGKYVLLDSSLDLDGPTLYDVATTILKKQQEARLVTAVIEYYRRTAKMAIECALPEDVPHLMTEVLEWPNPYTIHQEAKLL